MHIELLKILLLYHFIIKNTSKRLKIVQIKKDSQLFNLGGRFFFLFFSK